MPPAPGVIHGRKYFQMLLFRTGWQWCDFIKYDPPSLHDSLCSNVIAKVRSMIESAILPRSFRRTYPVAVRGEGPWLWDKTGRRYLDLAGSAAVNLIGHGDPMVAKAIADQLAELEFVHSSQFTTE